MTTINGSTILLPLIASKSFEEHSPDSFLTSVKAMYELRQKGSNPKPKKPSFAEGLTLKRTKTGKVSITRSTKKRPFEYVLDIEIDALAKGYEFTKAETWNAFRAKNYIIARTRMDAEKIHADIKGITW
jgi:hypothetical protein